jgi:Flp pilus assembly protein TadD
VAGAAFALVRRPVHGFCGAAFFAILAPSSSVVPIATQTMAEHRMYLPLALIVIVAVVGLHRWLGRAGWFVAGGAVAALGFATVVRNADYRSNESLWRDTVGKRPLNPRAHCSLGDALFVAGQPEAAIPFYREALRLKPEYGEALVNLGCALLALDRPLEAVEPLESALRLQPAFAKTHHNLANALARSGRGAEALSHYAAAAKLKPGDVTTLCDWGNALQRAGDAAGAIARYEGRRSGGSPPLRWPTTTSPTRSRNRAGSRRPSPITKPPCGSSPTPPRVTSNLASALAQSGRFTDARQH